MAKRPSGGVVLAKTDFHLQNGVVLDSKDEELHSEDDLLEWEESNSENETDFKIISNSEEEDATNESFDENSDEEDAEEDPNDKGLNKEEEDPNYEPFNEEEVEENLNEEWEGSNDEDNGRDPWEDVDYTDTSDEEELRNTVGNIPLEWYDDYPHLGYNLDGKKIMKPLQGDQLDEFLRKMDDPNYWRTVHDKTTGKEIVLTDEDLDLIEKIQQSHYPETTIDPYAPYEDLYSHEKMIHPVTNRPEPKRRFLPSLWERKKIVKLVRGIKSGKIKPIKKPEKPRLYMLWNDQETEKLRPHQYIPAPKMRLPGHGESYNPPPEYLPTEEERTEWEETKPKERRPFIPTKYPAFHMVPAYHNFIRERFDRCLDLYLCPRQTRMRIQVEPEALLPKLPKPRDLQPFPSTESILYKGHTDMVKCIAVESEGQWLASASDDLTLRLWEVETGRCVRTIPLYGKPSSLEFCPNTTTSLLSLTLEQSVVIINHGLGDRLVVMATDSALASTGEEEGNEESPVEWRDYTTEEYQQGYRLYIQHDKNVRQVTWHFKGDYFASVIEGGGTSAVYIHQLSKRRSQNPFKSLKGLVQKVLFHPIQPLFFVATQTYVRIYNLIKQEISKKLITGVKWISSIAIHPQGDNLIIGSYDKKLCWFDMDLSVRPYKMLRHHRKAIRQVCYHRSYPLFASCSDDGTVIICHGMVYSDLMQNPLIVPVKVLRGHSTVDTLGILGCTFHPTQPWLFSAGADSFIKLFT